MIANPKVKSKLYRLQFDDGTSLELWAKDKETALSYIKPEYLNHVIVTQNFS